jgi:acyl-[acyl-carrier-protein]-phospholipid O-acyltransferase/long-chain-fatty-acid--[acyl-carrier-protein] ligase
MTVKQNNALGRSFNWFNLTQFFGALNDNIFQGLLIFFLIGLLGEEKASGINAWAGMVFVVPFLIFTPFAGTLADRFSKSRIIVLAKAAELLIMLLGLIAFHFNMTVGIYVILFLMCAQSAFFGPCKYGVIPELVRTDQISRANSFLVGLTYLAIVVGAAAGPFLTEITRRTFSLAALACVALAAAGLLTSFGISRTPAMRQKSKVSLLFFKDVIASMRQIHHDKGLVLAIWGSAYFMLIGGFAKINLIPYGMQVRGYTDTQSGYLFLVAAIGIGTGSWLAGKLSGRSVEFGIIPLGALGMAFCSIGLGLVRNYTVATEPLHDIILDSPSRFALITVTLKQFYDIILTSPDLFSLVLIFGISAGLFIVPINAFIQIRCPETSRGRVLAASSFLGWIGVLLASILIGLFNGVLGVPARWVFLLMGLLTLALALFTLLYLPDFLVRLFLVLVTRLCYRIKTVGLENVPVQGPALLVSNHVSWADGVILMATQPRRIRFVIDRQLCRIGWLRWMFKLGKAITISPTDPPRQIVASLREARQALDEGCLVCIFAEGALTRTGLMGRFHEGLEHIVRGTGYPIIPVYLGGVWGSVLSHYYGPLFSALPRRLPYPVGVHFGEPMSSESTTDQIRLKIEELAVDYFNAKKPRRLSLGETLVHYARRRWIRPGLSDTTGRNLTFGKALIAAVLLRDKLAPVWRDQKNIGIFLPSSVGSALANFAVALAGRVSVNLSYIASENDRRHMTETAEIQTVITSRAFLEKLNLSADTLPGAVFLEDLMQRVTGGEKLRATMKALFWPRSVLARSRGFDPDDTAVILFSSGSSGQPKGVMLSHHNILSNLEGALMIFRIQKNDRLCAILPLFHSFGLTCTLWLPILAGVPVCFVPNPLDSKLVGQTIKANRLTLLFATPTFLLSYIRRCEADDFSTIRFLIAGAEKLKPDLIDAFEKKFGIRPKEGYGATETSPLIALNVDNAEVAGVRQVGTKEGTVGHYMPNTAVKVLDPETGEILPRRRPGVLWVKGPNVMKGYLKMPEKTAQVLQDGWYNTGDVVTIEEDGFVTITDRLSRFSKIGGEMVPHLRIEDVVQDGLKTHEKVVAVTSLPDEKKGEQLILLYDVNKTEPDRLYEILTGSSLPKLFIPRRENLIGVDEIPLLGSGKLDILRLREKAREALARRQAE